MNSLPVGAHPCGRLGVAHALQTLAHGVGSYTRTVDDLSEAALNPLPVGAHPCGRLGVAHALQTFAHRVSSYKDQCRGMPEVPTTNGHGRENEWIGAVYVA
ncbi:hypothetical protein [Limnohabitans sp. DM1]|uniref:hypothetical protein n=1 Tax=Limnohabitans sp. DM1 TaxID=1597955 RepID=UPI001892A389|nr:hypothetical protein [Limnohabitans sp. DM1]